MPKSVPDQIRQTIDGKPTSDAVEFSIADIIIGERHRRDLGDIEALAASIADIGLLHPAVITPQGVLIAGERRIRAYQRLGREAIPVTIVNLGEIARGEHAENAFRKEFTQSEGIAIQRAIEPLLKAEARQRQVQGGKLKGDASAKLAGAKGNSRDLVAQYTGKARTSMAKAKALVEALEAEPQDLTIAKLVEAMDKSGRVDGPYRRLMNMKQAEAIRAEPPPLPNKGPYRAGMVDIAWAYEPTDHEAAERGVLPYSTMSIDQACALDVASIMHQDSALGFWVTNYILAQGHHLPVLRAWEFEPKVIVTWPKDRAGRGHYAKGQTEHLVIATRGKPIVTLSDQTTLLRGPFHLVNKGEHSSKPVEAYAFFELLFPAPRYADLFSRYRHSDRWDCHGYEAPIVERDTASGLIDADRVQS